MSIPFRGYINCRDEVREVPLDRTKLLPGRLFWLVGTALSFVLFQGCIATRTGLLLTASSVLLGIVVSLLITRSITVPLSVLKRKTGDVAKGDFRGDLTISSPAELRELATAFNLMCSKLRDLDKLKSDFFASMSHELRTPLSSIKEGIGLLLEDARGAVSERQRKVLLILAEESNRLIAVVTSLLDLSKMEAGMMTYHMEAARLEPLVGRVMVEMEPLAQAKRIHLETRVDGELPILKIDSKRIL